MTIGERIEERRKALGIVSQSELARRAEIRQSTLSGLIRKPYRWSPYLVQIARALETTVEYLTGDTEDPDGNAPPPAPAPMIQHVMMPVALPSENALADMFEGLLLAIGVQTKTEAEAARELAQLLPTAMSQLRAPLFEFPARPPAPPVVDFGAPASADREPTR
jgi:transcriptional regulator with XRE-family HTH domain